MTAETATITLGERTFAVRPLKLGQLRKLLDALTDLGGASGGASIDASVSLLVAGLPNETLTPEILLDLDASLDELNEAVAVVCRVAGRLKRSQPGEVKPQPEA